MNDTRLPYGFVYGVCFRKGCDVKSDRANVQTQARAKHTVWFVLALSSQRLFRISQVFNGYNLLCDEAILNIMYFL